MSAGLLSTKDPTFDERGNRIPHRNSRPRPVLEAATSQLAADLARGRGDAVYWADRFLGIRLHRSQRRWVRAATARMEGTYLPAFLTTVVSAGNRAGKTLCLAIIIAHHCFYKLGLRPPKFGDKDDSMRWARVPYHWYHVAPQLPIAELVYNELVRVFTEAHPAQFDRESGASRGCPLVAELGAGIVSFEKKERGEYLWIRFHPVVGGAEIHFRSTDEKAKALLGLDANGISIDEAAFELYLDTIRHEVLQSRRLSTGGPLHAISTPTEGYNPFADWWQEGDPENINRDARTISLRLSTRDNVGYGITPEVFESLLVQMPTYLVPQNIDGHFIEAAGAFFHAPSVEAVFDRDMPPETAAERGHRYVNGVDPGISSDDTGCVVIDYTSRPFRGVRLRKSGGRQTIPAVVNMVNEQRLLYQQDGALCTTLLDSTGMGGKMFRQEFSIIKPLREYDFAGTKAKKLELLSDLKAAIDRGDLRLPRGGHWDLLRRQLLGYKLEDKKLETDLLMALALAVRHAIRNPTNPVANPTFEYFGAA